MTVTHPQRALRRHKKKVRSEPRFRFGPKAEVNVLYINVRLTPKSGPWALRST